MDKLQTLKLSDNFDVWRDLINETIGHVNNLYEVPAIPQSDTSWQIIATNIDPITNEYVLQWRDIRDFLSKLGITSGDMGGGGTTIPDSMVVPNGITAGNYILLYPNGDIENSGNIKTTTIDATGNITSLQTIKGNKVSAVTSVNAQGVELEHTVPYINFSFINNNGTKFKNSSQIIENTNGILTINGNQFSKNGSRIHTDLTLFTENNDVIFKNNDTDFSISNGAKYPFRMNLTTGKITTSYGLDTSTLHCTSDATFDKSITVKNNAIVSGTLTVNQSGSQSALFDGSNSSITGNLDVTGKLTVGSMEVGNMSLQASSLILNPNIHTGANSTLVSNIYLRAINKTGSTNSPVNDRCLVLRNDGSYAHILASDTKAQMENGEFNSFRPFSFSLTNGDVTIGSNTSITGTLTTNATTMNGALKVNSTINATGDIRGYRVYNAVFNDYAEFFEKGEETEVGDIIALDMDYNEERYIKATNPRAIVGVHSDSYGHILGGMESIEDSEESFIPVGMSGRVKTKIVGAIEKGDEVVLSQYPGIGRKFQEGIDRERDIIGFAVETNLSEEVKLVRIKI